MSHSFLNPDAVSSVFIEGDCWHTVVPGTFQVFDTDGSTCWNDFWVKFQGTYNNEWFVAPFEKVTAFAYAADNEPTLSATVD